MTFGWPRGPKGGPKGTQGEPKGNQRKPKRTQGDPKGTREAKCIKSVILSAKTRGTQGDPRETQGHPRGTQGDPRGVNRAWRLDETAFHEKVLFCKSQIGPGASTKATTTSPSIWPVMLSSRRNARKSEKHHFYEVKVRGLRLGGLNNNIY